jgi:ribosomal protein S18 acetylase RimI-like enzyme
VGRLQPDVARALSRVELRSVEPGDEEFLLRVYASTRAEELAVVPWTDAEKNAFLRMQFEAQRLHYTTYHPAAAHDVVLIDGEPVGRLYVDRGHDEICVVDIALLPEYRGLGIGTELLAPILAEADAAAKKVSVHVEHTNRARRLYERLGFVQIADRGVYALLERTPRSASTTARTGDAGVP